MQFSVENTTVIIKYTCCKETCVLLLIYIYTDIQTQKHTHKHTHKIHNFSKTSTFVTGLLTKFKSVI